MRSGRRRGGVAVGGRVALLVALLGVAAPAQGASDDARYALVKGCYALRAPAADAFVVRTADGTYRATAKSSAEGEPFRMQATALGAYLLYGRARDFLSADGAVARSAAAPSPSADFRVDVAPNGTFRLDLPGADGKVLSAGDGGALTLAPRGTDSAATRFTFAKAEGCPSYPEAEVNATGEPSKGATPFGEVRGYLDAHMHLMAFEFIGGSIHCGRPWHPYGVTSALVDCPDHGPGGAGGAAENALSYGGSKPTHDPVGWPTFKDWPNPESLTHETSYYKWLERAWRGGLRTYVNLLVDNAVLCEAYPLKRNSCNEMDGVRLQARRIRELEGYIDAQEGGPGKGWFRIVKSPFEAREVVNQGKLAVVMGIEISKLFDCGVYNDQPDQGCTRASIDRQLDAVYDLGVRDMELVNKFDNAFAGVAGDAGQTGTVVNNGNKLETNKYWQMQTCQEEDHTHSDREQTVLPGGVADRDQLAGNLLQSFLPAGTAPAYPAAPHCNARGLSDLGEHLIRRMIAKGMIIDPDHLSVRARQQVMSLIEAERHSGVISSHTWSTPDVYPRIYRAGGLITPYAGNAETFVKEWAKTRVLHDGQSYFGFGWGADMNGLGSQGLPRKGAPNPVVYPFKSFDGVTLDRQRSGERVFDINVDGVAHYGLYPDWVEDLTRIAGPQIRDDLVRGSESYLQMWERANGVPRSACLPTRTRLESGGLGAVRLGDSTERVLRSATQPGKRPGRAWEYCAPGRDERPDGVVRPVFTPRGTVALIASTQPEHRAFGIGTGAQAKRIRGARRLSRTLRRRGRYVYGIRGGRVRYVAVASAKVARSRSALREHLRLAGF